MTGWNDHELPPELQDVERRLRAERRDASALELDALKQRVRRQAASNDWRATPLKARIVTAILTVALIGGGGGAVYATAGGGGNDKNQGNGNGAANSQYCPPKSPGAGKPKDPPPGNACGHPNQGNPNPEPGPPPGKGKNK